MFGKTRMDVASPDHAAAPHAAPASGSGAESIISAGICIKGEMSFEDALRIDGRFEGQLKGGGQLHTGRDSRIVGEATVGQAVIEGTVEGNVTASERIELTPTAKVTGDIRAPRVVVAEGASLMGTCIIGPQLQQGEKAAETPAATEAA